MPMRLTVHFAAMEAPEQLVADVRELFRKAR
jgi:hypothetical protein